MGADRMALVVCMYCGAVLGEKTVSVPDSFDQSKKPVTHGICASCLSERHPDMKYREAGGG
jgi:hypothetical protein